MRTYVDHRRFELYLSCRANQYGSLSRYGYIHYFHKTYIGFFLFPDGFPVKRDPESNDTFDNVMENVDKRANDFFADKIVMLEKGDVPGASLNGKKPSQLTVGQLKRWLACHGAPLSGRKPELIQRLANCVSFY